MTDLVTLPVMWDIYFGPQRIGAIRAHSAREALLDAFFVLRAKYVEDGRPVQQLLAVHPDSDQAAL